MNEKAQKTLHNLQLFSNTTLTEEQVEICNNFDRDMIVFADPGTGKTMTVAYGLAIAWLGYGIPSDKIICMSFTNEATREIAKRHTDLCRKLRYTSEVKFSTFHSMALSILREYRKNIKPIDRKFEDTQTQLLNIAKDQGIFELTEKNVKAVAKAIASLNAKGITDEATVTTKKEFKKLGISFDSYDKLRIGLFNDDEFNGTITQGDIPYFAIYYLKKNPDLLEKIRNKYELVVIDEFQDMSFIYLTLLNLISKRCIVIGDMKQQIYAFNGSSEDIINQYLKVRPDCKQLKLSRSFRCGSAIASYASKLIRFNKPTGFTGFNGAFEGGNVSVIPESSLNYDEILDDVQQAYDQKKFNSHMFLFRTNSSGIRIIDELYSRKIPIISEKYKSIFELPIVNRCTELINFAQDRRNPDRLNRIYKQLPEFKDIKDAELPIVKLMKKDPEKAKYFELKQSTKDFNKAVSILCKKDIHKEPFINLYDFALDIIQRFYTRGKWIENTVPFSLDYYRQLIVSVVKDKSLDELWERETNKVGFIKQCTEAGIGIKCLTIHGSKGLEADKVYVFDYDNCNLPEMRTITSLEDEGYTQDACEYIRSERNLAFVAVTRAKKELCLIYQKDLSVFDDSQRNVNPLQYYDDYYTSVDLNVNREIKIGSVVINKSEEPKSEIDSL